MRNTLKYTYEIIAMIVGCAITAFGVKMLITPAHLLSGGVQGISMILDHFTHFGIGLFYFVFNIPLLILGYKFIGKKFTLYTVLGVIFLSLFLDLFKIESYWTLNPLLCAVFGGFLSSLGSVIVLRYGGSTGGLDILGRIVAKYKDITIAKFNTSINLAIVLSSVFLFEIESTMYTIIAIIVGMITYEQLLTQDGRISVFIVTSKSQEVSDAILKEMNRGVTVIPANGAFTHTPKDVLVSVIVKIQWSDLKRIVTNVDENAFMFVMSNQSVVGNFKKAW